MGQINDGGPAFPTGPAGDSRHFDDGLVTHQYQATQGMSLRDWFAGMALSAFLSSETAQRQLAEAVEAVCDDPNDRRIKTNKILAKRCYWLADAMIDERDDPHPKPRGSDETA